jgi:hypothetical protein
MRELPQAFWDALDDAPQRRAGGFIVGMEGKPRVRSERRNAEYRSRFPRREARAQWLKLTGYLLEKEEEMEREENE